MSGQSAVMGDGWSHQLPIVCLRSFVGSSFSLQSFSRGPKKFNMLTGLLFSVTTFARDSFLFILRACNFVRIAVANTRC